MDLDSWMNARGGIAERRAALAAGFGPAALRPLAIGRRWLATPSAPAPLRAAAERRARLTCVSAAAHLGLALLHGPERLHLAVAPNADVRHEERVRFHTGRAHATASRPLLAAVPDMLEHAAVCLPLREAHVVWESAVRKELITLHELRRVPWRRAASRRLVGLVDDKSDSLLESLLALELRERGIAFIQQAHLLGRPVDFLVGGRLVVQLDGYEHHADARQRRADIEHDARLELRGTPVLRRDYVQVVHQMPATVDLILRRLAVAAA